MVYLELPLGPCNRISQSTQISKMCKLRRSFLGVSLLLITYPGLLNLSYPYELHTVSLSSAMQTGQQLVIAHITFTQYI